MDGREQRVRGFSAWHVEVNSQVTDATTPSNAVQERGPVFCFKFCLYSPLLLCKAKAEETKLLLLVTPSAGIVLAVVIVFPGILNCICVSFTAVSLLAGFGVASKYTLPERPWDTRVTDQ